MAVNRLQYQRHLEWEILFPYITHLLIKDPIILEIGSGGGYQADHLMTLGKAFFLDLGIPNRSIVRYVVGNGEFLPYKNQFFDVIYTSHVVEHVINKNNFFHEIKRVAKKQAIYIHIVPTHVWKLLADIDYYPLTLLNGVKKVLNRKLFNDDRENKIQGTPNGALSIFQLLRTKLLPPIHGTSKSLIEEYVQFQPKSWRRMFESFGFKVVAEIPLLTYSPPELMLIPPNRFLTQIGLPSSIAFALR